MLTLMIPAAPIPWTARATVSTGKVGARAQASDARVKSARPGR